MSNVPPSDPDSRRLDEDFDPQWQADEDLNSQAEGPSAPASEAPPSQHLFEVESVGPEPVANEIDDDLEDPVEFPSSEIPIPATGSDLESSDSLDAVAWIDDDDDEPSHADIPLRQSQAPVTSSEPMETPEPVVAARGPSGEGRERRTRSLAILGSVLWPLLGLAVGAGGIFYWKHPQLTAALTELQKNTQALKQSEQTAAEATERAAKIARERDAAESAKTTALKEKDEAEKSRLSAVNELAVAEKAKSDALMAAKASVEALTESEAAKEKALQEKEKALNDKSEADKERLTALEEKKKADAALTSTAVKLIAAVAAQQPAASTAFQIASQLAKTGSSTEITTAIDLLDAKVLLENLSASERIDLHLDLADLWRLRATDPGQAVTPADQQKFMANALKHSDLAQKLLESHDPGTGADADKSDSDDKVNSDDDNEEPTPATSDDASKPETDAAQTAPTGAPGKATDRDEQLARLALTKSAVLERQGQLAEAEAELDQRLKTISSENPWKLPLEIGRWRIKLQRALPKELPTAAESEEWQAQVKQLSERAQKTVHWAAAMQVLVLAHLVSAETALAENPPETVRAASNFEEAEQLATAALRVFARVPSGDHVATLDRRLGDLLFEGYSQAQAGLSRIPTEDFKTLVQAAVKKRDALQTAVADLNRQNQQLSDEATKWRQAESGWASAAQELAKLFGHEVELAAANERWESDKPAAPVWIDAWQEKSTMFAERSRAAEQALLTWDEFGAEISKSFGVAFEKADSDAKLRTWQTMLRAASDRLVENQALADSRLKIIGNAEAQWASLASRAAEELKLESRLPPAETRWEQDRQATLTWIDNWSSALQDRLSKLHLYKQPFAELGEQLYRAKEFQKAENVFTTMIRSEPNSPLAYGNRAVVWMAQKKWSNAIEDFEQALKLSPEDASLHYGCAWAHARAGHQDPARTHLEQAIALDPIWKQRPDPTQLFARNGAISAARSPKNPDSP